MGASFRLGVEIAKVGAVHAVLDGGTQSDQIARSAVREDEQGGGNQSVAALKSALASFALNKGVDLRRDRQFRADKCIWRCGFAERSLGT